MKEAAIGEESAFLCVEFGSFGKGPLNSAKLIEHLVIGNSRDVARLIARKLFEDLKHSFGRRPSTKQIGAAPEMGDQLKNGKV